MNFLTIGLVVVFKSYTNFHHYQASSFEINLFEIMWRAVPLFFFSIWLFCIENFFSSITVPAILAAAPTLRKFLISNTKIKKKTNREIKDGHKPEEVYFDFVCCPTSLLNNFLIV